MRIGSLFSGYGGLDLAAADVLGGTVAWHAEYEPPTKANPRPTQAAARVLAHRFPGVPNLGDVTAVDWSAVEPVDVLAGGFPCQDVSDAGRRAGIRPDTRSGLWAHFAYAIDQLRPGLVLIENVRGLLSADAHHPAHDDLEPCPWCVGDRPARPLRALGAVLGELANLGYNASWHGLPASDVGAPHGRFRVFVLAWPAAHPGGEAVGLRPGLREGGPARVGRGRPDHHRAPAPIAHPEGDRRQQGRTQPARLERGPDAAICGDAAAHPDRDRREVLERGEPGVGTRGDADGRGQVDWGPYALAVRRWERRLGRPAPAPTEPTARGSQRLAPAFVEWMMGLPAGWVTGVPGLTRNDQLKALGNGVVPQQAAAALRQLLDDVPG